MDAVSNFRRRIARRIGRWIAPHERYETEVIRQNRNGSVAAKHTFRSLEDAKRYARLAALERNPLGRRAIQWLIHAGK
ncbi:MAG: hypothetical protein WB766_06370 [Roseiarcus sp.]